MIAEVFQIFNEVFSENQRKLKDSTRPMPIDKFYADHETIVVDFHGKHDSIVIDTSDYVEWFNDVSKDRVRFKPLDIGDIDEWSLTIEDLMLYLRWELGLHGVFFSNEGECLRNEDYPEG